MKKYAKFLLTFLFCSLVCIGNARGATVTATSCSGADVQAAVNSASDGDTISVPSGNCTWSSPVSIVNKAFTLQGAGAGSATINNGSLQITGASGKSFRITGFSFVNSNLSISGTSKTWRVDHNAFTGALPISVNGYTYGVIDHNTQSASSSTGFVEVYDTTSGSGNSSWLRPLSLGTADAVYIEDNTISYTNYQPGEGVFDGRSGGRFVFRHNTCTNCMLASHDACVNQQRGIFSWEVYENTFNYTFTSSINYPTAMRGGTGVLFNNHFTAPNGSFNLFPNLLYFTNYRSFNGCGAGQTPWDTGCSANSGNMCLGGSNSLAKCSTNSDCLGGGVCTSMDGTGASGYPCRDQLGWTTDQPNAIVPYSQTKAPAYFWGNTVSDITHNAQQAAVVIDGNASASIQLNRDYYQCDSNQTCGGTGCAQCSYTAYTYPHPLTGSGTTAKRPNPPTNLRIL